MGIGVSGLPTTNSSLTDFFFTLNECVRIGIAAFYLLEIFCSSLHILHINDLTFCNPPEDLEAELHYPLIF